MNNWRKDPRFEDISKTDLPSICLAVRMSLNGASPPMEDAELSLCVSYIRARLIDWRPSLVAREALFDESVRAMCAATLWIYEWRKSDGWVKP